MLPYFDQPVWRVGPLSIYAFGVVAAIAAWLGLRLAQDRFDRLGGRFADVTDDHSSRWILSDLKLPLLQDRRASRIDALQSALILEKTKVVPNR